MADPISNLSNPCELGVNLIRPQPSAAVPGRPDPQTNLQPDQRVEVLQGAVEKLIKKSLPTDSKLQIGQDKTTGTFIYRSIDPVTGEVLQQWPSEKMLELHDFLKGMQGMLVDKQA
jgi:uncharacterized FlaG/YvyC family protein